MRDKFSRMRYKRFPRFLQPRRYAQTGTTRTVEMADAGVDRSNVAIYVHYPFCLQLCSMCNFNKYRAPSSDGVDDRVSASLVTELQSLFLGSPLQTRFAEQPTISSVYFGGGTPSIASVSLVNAVLDAIRPHNLAADAEITLEANPKTFDADKLRAWTDAGVNRLSIGVQSLTQRHLDTLNRDHTVLDSLRSMELARRFIPTTSIDMIYGMPGQAADDLRHELTELFHQGAGLFDHLSMYELTLEKHTPLHDLVDAGKVVMPSSDLVADLTNVARETAALYHFPQYEVSSYCHQGLANNMSKHNRAYWFGCDYAGVGPGAHGRVTLSNGTRARTLNIRDPKGWMEQVQHSDHGMAKLQPIDRHTWIQEVLMMHLRTLSGITTQAFHQLTGQPLHQLVQQNDDLIKDGFLKFQDNRLTTTPHGHLVLDALLLRLAFQPSDE